MSTTAQYDTIVIGAGLSGLAAGVRLAQFDKRVVVLEKHALWGGLNSFYRRAGRRLDTGLHALTNYVPKNTAGAPLSKLLRQLRISHDELRLSEQTYSEIVFPQARLRFGNQLTLLREEVQAAFPARRDAFERLVRLVREADPFDASSSTRGARAILSELLGDALLVDMLLLPLCYYGSAAEDDIDWTSFVILFRSIFCEGFARPDGGIKRILELLLERYREAGGELRMRSGVARIECTGRTRRVVLEDGTELEAERVLSSAGYAETMQLCGRVPDEREIGRLSFVEALAVTAQPLASLGHRATITFFNTAESFEYRRPRTLVDARSGVICCTDNYATPVPPVEGLLRVTLLANHDAWCALDEPAYRSAKEAVWDEMRAYVNATIAPIETHVVWRDLFTPRTIRFYTGHLQGAVYGSPHKRRDGNTEVLNVHLIGTDQGFVGVVGALMSGIMMANIHSLGARVEASLR
jgi:phytoene dehydrogenase-like protein